jgi:hypothetical protein
VAFIFCFARLMKGMWRGRAAQLASSMDAKSRFSLATQRIYCIRRIHCIRMIFMGAGRVLLQVSRLRCWVLSVSEASANTRARYSRTAGLQSTPP